uniref:Uncharacterized protein n=1 Tax=Rhabditophanes sp. KR3021 TaxID=114890 RepID=A0AC35TUM2_9BILA
MTLTAGSRTNIMAQARHGPVESYATTSNLKHPNGAVYYNPNNMSQDVQNLYFESIHFSIDDEEKLLLEEDGLEKGTFGTNLTKTISSKMKKALLDEEENTFRNVNFTGKSGIRGRTRLTNDDTDPDSPLDELNLILPLTTHFPEMPTPKPCGWSKFKKLFCCFAFSRGSKGILK